jgi:putative flavoprotein involved in K+ transport
MTDSIDRSADATMPTPAPQHLAVAVVGGGQAGLAIGYLLSRERRQFRIFEASEAIGAAWRARWDSLVLFTSRRFSALPGLPFPGDPDTYPTRDDVVAYLEQYAETFGLPVELDSEVRAARHDGDVFVLDVGGRTVTADQLVIATGPFHAPKIAALAAQLDESAFQIHSADYRRPADVPAGSVVVVGGGNTGYQIAKELSETHVVQLAIGSRQTPLPQRLLGRDIFWWLTKLGLFEKDLESRLGRRAKGRDTLIGSSPRALRRKHGIEVKPRLVDAADRTVTFADGSTLEPDAVIWATGYRPDHPWVQMPVFDEAGGIRHRRGVTDVGGLYFLGLSWQHTRGSALLGWVENDAAFIAAEVAAFADRGETTAARPEEATTAAPDTLGVPEGA